jgi:hypothetical protein
VYTKTTEREKTSDKHIRTFIWKLMSALTNSLEYKIVIKGLDRSASDFVCDNESNNKKYEFVFINEQNGKSEERWKLPISAGQNRVILI